MENQWAPVTVSWGIENRMGAIRVIVPPSALPNATRLEVVCNVISFIAMYLSSHAFLFPVACSRI